MKRITINALVNIGCLILFIPSLISVLVLYPVLPSGGVRGSGWSTYPGITRTQWVTMHDCTSLVFTALLILHLFLHGMFFRNIRKCFISKGKQDICLPIKKWIEILQRSTDNRMLVFPTVKL